MLADLKSLYDRHEAAAAGFTVFPVLTGRTEGRGEVAVASCAGKTDCIGKRDENGFEGSLCRGCGREARGALGCGAQGLVCRGQAGPRAIYKWAPTPRAGSAGGASGQVPAAAARAGRTGKAMQGSAYVVGVCLSALVRSMPPLRACSESLSASSVKFLADQRPLAVDPLAGAIFRFANRAVCAGCSASASAFLELIGCAVACSGPAGNIAPPGWAVT